MFTKKQKLRESCLKSPVVILLFTVLVSNTAFGQWKRIATFPFTAGVVYFQHKEGHPEVGFVGTWITEP
jgi:hypothetical protein